jgi:hypothetical protein
MDVVGNCETHHLKVNQHFCFASIILYENPNDMFLLFLSNEN